MQEYSRKFFMDSDIALDAQTENKEQISFDFHKPSTVERQEANRAKGLSFGSMRTDIMNSFYSFWKKLILSPESNKEAEDTPLTTLIIKEEGAIYEIDFLRGVLAEALHLDEKNPDLNKALHTCTKIYHEDYPGSYVLAYQGKRLGICFLNILKEAGDTIKVSYQFNSHITHFY